MLPVLSQLGASAVILASVFAAAEATVYTFDNEAEGALPSGWAAAKTGEGAGSVWKIVADDAGGAMGRALAQTSAEGPNALFNVCVLKDAKSTDVDLSVKVKAIGGVRDRGGGLVWRYRDENNYYVTRWNPLEDNFRLYHVVNGKRTQLANAEIKLPPEQWHTVRAVQRGNHIQCSLDGTLLLDVMDDTIKDAGAIGLWSKADAVTWFDNLSVSILAKE
jgi:hypothetical protein